jgi:hypothetical protein
MNQKQKVLRHLKEVGAITPLDAMQDYSIFRLASRICELKDEGHNIKTEMITVYGRFKDKVTFAKYTLLNAEEKENS